MTAEDPGSVVVPAPGVHTHTVVLLHPMYMAPEHAALCQDLPSFVRALGLPCVKFVFPTAPRRSISWPQGREDNIAAWYNYYTRRDGQDEHDIIDEVRQRYCCRVVCGSENELGCTIVSGANVGHIGLSLDQLLGASEVAQLKLVLLSIYQQILRLDISVD